MLNEKYKITETCGKVVNDVVTKTNDFLHSPEVIAVGGSEN